MSENDEQTIPLTLYPLISNSTDIDNQFHWKNHIKTIYRIGSHGPIELHVATYSKPCEITQLIFTDSALQSFKQIYDRTYPDAQSKATEIKNLFEKNANLFSSSQDQSDSDYIDWSPNVDILMEKHREFLEQINIYRSYDNRHRLIAKELFEIIEYYLSQYLINEENFPPEDMEKIKECFHQAIIERNYLKYFIEAYTLTNNFYKILNKHLAIHILDYFTSSSLPLTNYRLINCLVHIVTLLIHHPDRDLYKYQGITYRGVVMRRRDLKKYRIGYSIMNRSFVSTSKYRSVAQMFAGNVPSKREDTDDQTFVSVMFRYKIKQNRTAINIERLSTIKDEKEVLILPFGVFQVKDCVENDPEMSPPVQFEIDLEECEDPMETPEVIPERKKKRQQFPWLKFLLIILGISLIPGVYFLINKIISKPKPFEEVKGGCPSIINRSIWKAHTPKKTEPLARPVPYVAVLHTSGPQCDTVDSCILRIQSFQKKHMSRPEWNDIGYNFLIGADGDVFQGRGWDYLGSHCYGFNNRSIGIGLIGNFISTKIPQVLLDATKSLIQCGIFYGYIQKDYGIVGHWSEGVPDSFVHSLNRSTKVKDYCRSKNQTISLI